ncbi:PREDICTED: alpha-2,8-sialyltransferase 8F-like isoform X1 [Cyprinodon variegatus]|uniref:ST8 alpha-N-acetyl-neuraminide alpha-2,8-sialyltransferase 6 n=1 Tax=Cyprinodon variegatus TaxID=28743 RepID=A0A3Q2CXC9_CYPVA|nr:PREDICTED: alpha-2,8-sialyltransferase 8F-like isoform X1 [Cyprinodon variegatus]
MSMRRRILKVALFINFFFLVILLFLPPWHTMEKTSEKPRHTLKKNKDCSHCREIKSLSIDVCSKASQTEEVTDVTSGKDQPQKVADKKEASKPCKDCRKQIKDILEPYSQAWARKEEKHEEIRTLLKLKVSGYKSAIITQENTPVGSKLVMDGQKKRSIEVNTEHFETFLKENPFANKTYDSCAVVGNGGILANSSCGKKIDSADFVIRCNLAPLIDKYIEHVGMKTNLVSANPSIFYERYGSLTGPRRKFMEKLCQYGDSMLLLPTFSYTGNIAVCLRAYQTIQDFESPIQPIYFSPAYLKDLDTFWRSQGWKAVRLSTGMILTSMALELCDNVHLYGFWPFSLHPYTFKELTNHYYDDKKPKGGFHAMPEEFKLLLQLHSKGVLKLHLGDCEPNKD